MKMEKTKKGIYKSLILLLGFVKPLLESPGGSQLAGYRLGKASLSLVLLYQRYVSTLKGPKLYNISRHTNYSGEVYLKKKQ